MTAIRTRRSGIASRGGSLLALADIAGIALAFYIAAKIVDQIAGTDFSEALADLHNLSPYDRTYLYGGIACLVIFLFTSQGHYTQRIPWWNQIRLMVIGSGMAILAEGFASFALEIRSSIGLIALNWCLCFAFFVCFRLIFFKIRSKSKAWRIPTVVIGDASTVSDILYAFNAEPAIGYDVKRVFLRDSVPERFSLEDLPRRYAGLSVDADLEDYESYIAENSTLYFVVVLDTFRGAMRERIVEALSQNKARYAIVPSISRMSLYEMEPRYFFGYDVVLLQARSALSTPLSRFGKRLMDVTAASAGLLCFSPVFAVIVIALKIEGHEGSVFYGGERIGQDGRLFKCWKFRTMAPDSDHLLKEYLERDEDARAHWEKYLKLRDDPRVKTRTQALLRKSSLDEIPQLWNVFTGNMSVVGPRPILPNEIEIYGETYSEYINVKPGITGLWQVSGRNSMSFQRRVAWDSWYVRNWSLWGDIVIILKTVPAVLLRDDGH